MRILLDSHTFLWFVLRKPQLSRTADALISDRLIIAQTGIEQPTIYVIGGPNGVGKTTFANEFLPHYVRCNEFLNADLIAAGLSPYMPESQNVRASQLMLERMQDLVSQD